MSCARTMTVKNTSEDYIKFIITELLKLSEIDTTSNDTTYQCKDEVIRCLHNLVSDARERGKDTFSNFQLILNKHSDEEKKSSFNDVVESLFEDCIKWSRVIVAFMYIVQVLRMSQRDFEKYYNWSIELVLTKIYPWVKENGGWEHIVQLSNNRNHLDEVTEQLKKLGTVALGITGLFALGKWIFN